MGLQENSLRGLAKVQMRYTFPIFIIVLVMTVFLGIGVRNIHMQTDLTKEMPQDLPIFQLNDKVTDTFGGQDTIILLFSLDDSLDVDTPIKDIRHPYVIQSIIALEDVLKFSVDKGAAVKTYLLDAEVRGIFNEDVMTDSEVIQLKVENNVDQGMFQGSALVGLGIIAVFILIGIGIFFLFLRK